MAAAGSGPPKPPFPAALHALLLLSESDASVRRLIRTLGPRELREPPIRPESGQLRLEPCVWVVCGSRKKNDPHKELRDQLADRIGGEGIGDPTLGRGPIIDTFVRQMKNYCFRPECGEKNQHSVPDGDRTLSGKVWQLDLELAEEKQAKKWATSLHARFPAGIQDHSLLELLEEHEAVRKWLEAVHPRPASGVAVASSSGGGARADGGGAAGPDSSGGPLDDAPFGVDAVQEGGGQPDGGGDPVGAAPFDVDDLWEGGGRMGGDGGHFLDSPFDLDAASFLEGLEPGAPCPQAGSSHSRGDETRTPPQVEVSSLCRGAGFMSEPRRGLGRNAVHTEGTQRDAAEGIGGWLDGPRWRRVQHHYVAQNCGLKDGMPVIDGLVPLPSSPLPPSTFIFCTFAPRRRSRWRCRDPRTRPPRSGP